ncbi:MAG TPA: F0F1 ATP synthase subunit epsilon [Chloroflexota bacterium]|nr:F0F1 ATP synthase subunit epsilon [Chloroflexota bacterium]
MPLHVEIVAAERPILEDDVDEVLADTAMGQIGVLPRHAPLLTLLMPGEVRLRKGAEETVLAVGGGFLEVSHDRVVLLADSAERAEEIDLARAEEARRRAVDRLASRTSEVDDVRAQAALMRAMARLRVAERLRRRGGRVRSGPEAGGQSL